MEANKIASLKHDHPKVFISYSHDLQEHKDRVLHLSDRLRADGIDCNIDQYETSPPEGWPRWMVNKIEEADFVLVVCTETYERRFKGKEEAGKGLGVKWEGAVITQELYEAEAKNTNFIPIVFSPKDDAYIPIVLRGATHYEVNMEGYEALYRHLTNQPLVLKPELGKLRAMPPRERKQDFFDTTWIVPYSRNPFFTGREKIIEQLHEALKSGKAALSQPQAIYGLGGIGKTQTAVEFAYRYRDEYKAVLWAKADSNEALVSEFVAIAGLLNLPDKDAKEQNLAVDAVKRWLESNSGWLLIFDNADNPKLIEGFVPLNPKGHILLTSRAQVFDNLGIANPLELDKMLPDEAKQFLFKRTGRSNLEPAEIEAVEQLAKELDYLPLALEQAGAYITKLKCSFQDYRISYHKRGLELLEQAKVVTGKYPNSVATTWSLNFEQVAQVSEAAADLLFASAFLNHDKIPFEIITLGAKKLGAALSSALADVEADPLVLNEVLEPLTQFSLIQCDFNTRTYNIHRLVQAVLKDGMDKDTQCMWAERIVRAVNRAFPEVEFSNWNLCERLLPHAQACAELIEKWGLEFQEAARLLNQNGEYLCKRLRFAESEPFLMRSLEIRKKIFGQDHQTVAASLNNLGGLYSDQAKYDKAEPLLMRSLEIREKIFGQEHQDVSESLNNIASLYYEQGKYDKAESLNLRALAISEKIFGAYNPNVATGLSNLANVYHKQGKYEKAESLHIRSLAIREKILGPDHPDVANSLNNLAGLYCDQGKYDKAEPLYTRSLAIWEKTLGADHPSVATSLNNLAGLYCDLGKYDKAEPLYKRSLDIGENTFGPDHPDVATSLNNLGWLFREQGKYDKAETFLLRSLAIGEKSLGQDHSNVADSLNNLAILYEYQGQYIKSRQFYKQALAIYEKALGEDHPLLAQCLENFASLLRKINRNFEAAKMVARAKAIKANLAAKKGKRIQSRMHSA